MALAIFSMFFGAGNAIFPLILGMETQDQCGWAFIGLLLTAIGGPLLGLLGATLFHGKCSDFFSCTGKVPSAVLIAVTLALLGPFAVLPRCVTVAYAAAASFWPVIPLWLFALVFCLATLFCCWKQRLILPILGYFLSPVLIGCLLMVIYQGYVSEQVLVESSRSQWSALAYGISTGYDTMDLIASIYFASGIWTIVALKTGDSPPRIFKMTLKAGALGCLLLAFIYLGLTHAAAKFSPYLNGIPPEQLITRLANIALGPVLGTVASVAVILACLTTVISLAMTISNILCTEIFPNILSYRTTLHIILVITVIMANLGFGIIMQIIHPVVAVCYPFIILLTIVNIYRKLAAKLQQDEALVSVGVAQ